MTLEGTLDVTVDDGVPTIEFTVENTGSEPAEIRFTSGCKADFVVESNGTEHWRYTDGRMFTQVITTETLESGNRRTYTATGEPLEPGRYTAIATLTASSHDCQARTTFSV